MKKTTATTKTRSQRMFAMAMAAAMVVSMAPVTAFAEESASADGNGGTSQTASGENASGNGPTVTITVTRSDDGSETKETKSESTSESGASVTETKTETTKSDGTTSERTETTTTNTTTEDNDKGGTTTTTESDTEYKETTTAPTQTEPKADDEGSEGGEGSEDSEGSEGNEGNEDGTPEGNTETGYVDGSAASEFEEGTTTDVTTETEGNEYSSDTTETDHKDRVVEEYGFSGGSETTKETETSTEKYIEDRDELEDDSYTEGEEKTLEDTKGEFNNDGSVDTTEETDSVDPGYAGDITIELTPGTSGSGSASVDEEAIYKDLLADDRPESSETKGEAQVEDVTDEDGNVIGTKTTTTDEKTDVTDVKNDNNQVVGYEVTKTTTTTVVTEKTVNNTENYDPEVTTGESTTTTSEPVEKINLPERPVGGESTNEAGETTTTTVEDITDDNGNVVGYSVSTVTKDAAGKEIAWGGESIWGTKTITVTTTETLETTETKTEYITTTTTTTDITEGTTVNGVWITSTPRTATATMGQVTVGEVNGRNDLQALDIDVKDLLANLATNDLRNPKDQIEMSKQLDGETFQYIGHLVGSDYRIYRQNGSHTDVYIYVLKDADGNEFYGYCADVATSAKKGTLYEIANLEDESYYRGKNAEAHIRAIALNGFWGTESGTGSLDAVKKLLKDAGYKDWNTLTEGQALAATQAAMWVYGNNGNAAAPNGNNVTKYQYDWSGNPVQGDKNVQKLYEVLVGMTEQRDTSTNILDTGDILSSQIVIGEKTDHDNNKDDNNKNDVYNTNISFTVAIVPDKEDNLKAVVYQNGKKVGEQALTETNGTTDKNGNTTYTLNDLALQEGVNVNLSLEGTQNLQKGVYLYTAELGVGYSQTFVGVAEGTRTVDLDVNMTFNVNDETATKHTKSGSNSRSKSDKKVTQTTDTEINQEVVAMMEITTVTVTEYGSEWGEEYSETFKYNDKKDKDDDKEDKEDDKDEEKDEDKDDGDREEFIIDDDVPLAELPEVEIPLGDFVLDDVPKTNDASALWLALSGFSGIGLAGLFGRKRRK